MKRPNVVRAMPDESGTDGETKSSRKQVSKRSFITQSGSEAERIEEATGARYTLLNPAGNLDYDMQFGDAGKASTMFAVFGFHTKIGNVANTVLNDKDEPGTPADAGESIKEFMALAQAGKWAERAAGVAGSRIDKDALAAAVCEVAAAKGQTKDISIVREKLEDDPVLVRKLRANPEIRAAYDKRVGKAPATTEDALDLV